MRRDLFSVLGALALHGAVLALALALRSRPPPSTLPPMATDAVLTIELEVSSPMPEPEALAASAPAAAGPASGPPRARRWIPPELGEPALHDRAPAASERGADNDGATAPTPVLPGLGGAPIWAEPGLVGNVVTSPVPAPTRPAPPAPVPADVAGRVLRSALADRDRRLGLSPLGGAVASAVAAAVHSSTVPLEATGAFEVRFGADGKLAGIRVLGTSAGEGRAWNAAARAAASALRDRKVALPDEGPGGVVVRVDVESRNRYPAGSAQLVEPLVVCADEMAYDTIERADKDKADPSIPPLTRKVVETEDDGDGEFAASRIGKPPEPVVDQRPKRFLPCIPASIGVRFDLSNFGAHKSRTVRSTFRITPIPATSAPPARSAAPASSARGG